MPMIPVQVDQIVVSNAGFAVLLKGPEDQRCLPIFIGTAEAQAIALKLNGMELPRPLTHDLLKNLVEELGWTLRNIEICDLRDGTFYARLNVEQDGKMKQIDCRPSDAIALALRCAAPIFVDEKVMAEAGQVLPQPEPAAAPQGTAEKPKPRKRLTPLEATEKRMERAVKEERYEDAATLRDEINQLKKSHTHN